MSSGGTVAGYLSHEAWRLGRDLLDVPASTRSDYASVVKWSADAGLITVMEAWELSRQAQADPYTAADEVERIDDLVQTARTVRRERDTAAADRLAKAYHRAMEHATLIPQGQRWVHQDNALDLATIRRRAVRSIVMGLMTDQEPCPTG